MMGKVLHEGDLSEISIISEVAGFLLVNSCNHQLQPLLLSAAFQWQEWDETEGLGSLALHTVGHNTEREFGSTSDSKWMGNWGESGSNSSTNSTGMVLLSPLVVWWCMMDLIWNNVCMRVRVRDSQSTSQVCVSVYPEWNWQIVQKYLPAT